MMIPSWQRIDQDTEAMNVPGGAIIRDHVTHHMVFVPLAAVVMVGQLAHLTSTLEAEGGKLMHLALEMSRRPGGDL